MANLITGLRILCSAALLFCPVFSAAFYALYLAAGVTDMVDGTVARRLGTAGAFGARLDTIADTVFVFVCLYKLLPAVVLPKWLCLWIAAIALLKVCNLAMGYVIRKKLIAVHSILNKITGAVLFALPLTLPVLDLRYSAPAVCLLATLAAAREGYLIRTGRDEEI